MKNRYSLLVAIAMLTAINAVKAMEEKKENPGKTHYNTDKPVRIGNLVFPNGVNIGNMAPGAQSDIHEIGQNAPEDMGGIRFNGPVTVGNYYSGNQYKVNGEFVSEEEYYRRTGQRPSQPKNPKNPVSHGSIHFGGNVKIGNVVNGDQTNVYTGSNLPPFNVGSTGKNIVLGRTITKETYTYNNRSVSKEEFEQLTNAGRSRKVANSGEKSESDSDSESSASEEDCDSESEKSSSSSDDETFVKKVKELAIVKAAQHRN